jgi:hypothetical protein
MKRTITILTLLTLTLSSFSFESVMVSSMKKTKKSTSDKTIKNREGRGAYISISGGYGIPYLTTASRSPLKEIGDKYWYQRKGDLSVKNHFSTNGGGVALNIAGGMMFNKYIGIEGLLTVAWHPEALDAKIDITNYYATQKTSTFAMYLSPHVVFHWDNGGRFGLTAKVGPCLPFFGNVQARANIKDKQGRLIETLAGLPIIPLNTNNIPILNQIPNLANLEIELIGRSKATLNPTLGVSASLGADVKLSKNFTLFAEVRVQAYTITVKEIKFKEFKQTAIIRILGAPIPAPDGLLPFPSTINNVSEAPEYLKHIVFRKELNEESNTARYGTKSFFPGGDLLGSILNPDNAPLIDPDKPMDELMPKLNASSLYFNVGLKISFPSKKYNGESASKSTKTKKSKKSKTSATMLDDPDAGTEVK